MKESTELDASGEGSARSITSMRLSTSEREEIDVAAAKLGMPSSTFMRAAAVAAASGEPLLPAEAIDALRMVEAQQRTARMDVSTLIRELRAGRTSGFFPIEPVTAWRFECALDKLEKQ